MGKCHILTDTDGRLLTVQVHGATSGIATAVDVC